ncbi:MAG: hypothetical protein PVJ39_18980 [Gammaproteobacteria bacterium]|jgi:hypothetical protein
MSTKDKTRDKLVNSMRKTKAVINDQSDSKQAHADTYTPPAARSAKATKDAGATKPAEVIKKLPSIRPEVGSDPYQSRGRVWPD